MLNPIFIINFEKFAIEVAKRTILHILLYYNYIIICDCRRSFSSMPKREAKDVRYKET